MPAAESRALSLGLPQPLPLRMRMSLADACAANDTGSELRVRARALGFVGCSYFARFGTSTHSLPEVVWSTHGDPWDCSYRFHALAHGDLRLVKQVSLASMSWG